MTEDGPEIDVEASQATVVALVAELDQDRYHLERFRSIEIPDPALADMIAILADVVLTEIADTRQWLVEPLESR